MNSNTFRQWLGTISLAVIAITLVLMAVLYTPALTIPHPPAPPTPSGVVGIRSASNLSGIQTDDGSVSAPSHSFTNDTDSGIYRIGANDVGVAVNGVKEFEVSAGKADATHALSIGGVAFSGPVQYGKVISYTSNSPITTTLTFSSTTSACVVTSNSSNVTGTVNISATNSFSITTATNGVNFFWFCGQ